MSGKLALITGAGRGIGRTVALGLAEDGYSIAACARNREELSSFDKSLKERGVGCLVDSVDVRDRDSVLKFTARATEEFGFPYIVFNNAGVNHPGTYDLSPEQFAELFDVNVKGAWNVICAVAPLMKQRREGHIFNVSSVAGKVGFAGMGAYCATKFALRGLNESLFRELVPEGVKVTALCPSWVDTKMASYAPMPSGQRIQTEDLLSTVRYLLRLSPAACAPEIEIQCRYDLF